MDSGAHIIKLIERDSLPSAILNQIFRNVPSSTETETFTCEATLTRFLWHSDAMLQAMLARVKLELALSGLLVLFEQRLNLLLVQWFTVCALVHAFDLFSLLFHQVSFHFLGALGFLDGLGHAHRLLVVQRRIEIDVNIGLDNADLIVRLAVNYVDEVVAAAVVDADGVAFVHASVVR